MKLAVYNVENLFSRAKVMNDEDWSAGKETLNAFAQLSALLSESNYTTSIKTKMVALMIELGLEKDDKGPAVILRRNRGALLKRPQTGGLTIVADGRADWVGSLELIEEPINHESMLMTARVIRDVNADVIGFVEAESRPVLQMFNDKILKAVTGDPYSCTMLIDGNDMRGIDVGIALRSGYTIDSMQSHVHERLPNGENLFSRDCPEFVISLPSGETVLVLVNHFKSKGFGSTAKNNAKRKAQSQRVRELYDERLADGYEYIAIIGDLNDTPASDPLKPLHTGTSMKDVFKHPKFDDGGYSGTFGLCNASNKIDYMLLSPKLFSTVQDGGVWRMGMWPGKRPVRWPVYPELTKEVHAGSDHACLWIELNL